MIIMPTFPWVLLYPTRDKAKEDRQYHQTVFAMQKNARYNKRFKRVMAYLEQRAKRAVFYTADEMRAFEKANPKPKYRVKAVTRAA